MTTTRTTTIAFATSDAEIAACFPVMRQLRPHLAEDDFVPRVRRMQGQGFQLAYARDAGAVVVVAGHVLQWPAVPMAIAGASLCFFMRLTAIRRGWRLPVAKDDGGKAESSR